MRDKPLQVVSNARNGYVAYGYINITTSGAWVDFPASLDGTAFKIKPRQMDALCRRWLRARKKARV